MMKVIMVMMIMTVAMMMIIDDYDGCNDDDY